MIGAGTITTITRTIREEATMTKTLTLLALASTMIAGPALAQRRPAAAVRDPLTLDIAGVRLGMKRTDVQAALAGKYRCQDGTVQDTFAQMVEDGVKARKGQRSGRWGGGQGVSYDECEGANGEDLAIFYAEVQGGPIVHRLRLSLPNERFAATEMRRALLAKFGPPTIARADGGSWCSTGYRCDEGLELVEGPKMDLHADSQAVVVIGVRGLRAREVDRAALTMAIDRLAPKKSNAAF